MPQPKHTLINVDDFWKKVKEAKEAKEENIPTLAPGNLSGITFTNARTALPPQGYYEKLNKKVKLDIFGDRSNWEEIGLSQQTDWNVVLNTFYGGLLNFAAGVVENAGANDLKGIYDMSMNNTEAHYGNILHRFANSLREKSEKDFHIYNDKDNSIFSIPYWGKQLQNFGYSAGIITEGFVELGTLTAIAGPAGAAAFGPYQGLKEAYINGLQTGEETYKKYIDVGYNEEEAKQKANEAATLGFRREVIPLMILNGFQFAVIGKANPFMKKSYNFGFSGGVETLADKALNNVKNKYLRKISPYVIQGGAEAIEEAIQTGVSKEAQYEVKHASGLVGKKQIEDRIFDDDEMKDSMIGGALGGLFFGFMGNRFNKLVQGTRIKQQKQTYNDFLQNVATRVKTDTEDLKKAFDSGDQNKIDVVRKRLQRNNVFEALKLDLINQNESAFNTYVSILQETNTAAQNGDIEKLKSLGIEKPEDVTHIKENYQTFIDDAYNIKKKLIENLKVTDNYDVAVNLSNNEKTLEELNEFEERSKNKISKIKFDNKQYSKLTSIGKRKFDLALEQATLVAKAQKNQISPFQKERLDEITQELKTIREENKMYAGKKSDERIINTLKSEELINEHLNILEFQHYQDIISEKIKYWKNPTNQKKEEIKTAKKKIVRARSKSELEKAKEKLATTNTLTPEIEEIVNDKIEKKDIKEITNPNDDFSSIETPPKKEINDKRRVIAQEITSNVVNEKDFSQMPDQELFEPQSISNITSAQKAKLKSSIADYYESLKSDINKEPLFQDFVKDFIKNNDKQTADKIYNALVEGWKANNYKKVDFNKVYNEIFKDRKQISSDIINIAEDIIKGSPESKEEIAKSNEETLKEIVEKEAPPVETDEYNNRPKMRDDDPFVTSSSEFRAAYLSSLYERIITNEDGTIIVSTRDLSDELSNSKYINYKKLLNSDLFNIGTTLTVEIPKNYREIEIATWKDDLTKGPSMTFSKWMEKNKIEEGSQAWLNKIPMIAYDKDGEGVFFIHDTEWYNLINVGFKDDPIKQSKIITEARKKLTDLRKKVYNDKTLKIKITNKRPGTWKQIKRNEKTITLNDANPQSQIALGDPSGGYSLNGKENFEKDGKKVINKNESKSGRAYDMRRSTTSNTYIAFEVLREKINPQVINTVKEVIKAYLYQYDDENKISDNKATKNLRKQILTITGFDVFDREDFENFINLYVPTIKGKFSDVSDIINAVESNNKLKIGTPYISIQNGRLIFGTKGNKNKTLYLHPEKINDQNGSSQMASMLSQFEKLLPYITQHVSKKGLAENRATVTIDETGTVIPGKDYRTFLGDNLKTSIKSFNVGTKDDPVYATIIQPVINFEEAKDDWKQFVDTGKVSESKVDEISKKIRDGKSLTSKEEAMRQKASEEIEIELKKEQKEITGKQTLKNTYESLKELGVDENNDDMRFLRKQLGENENYEPTDADIKALIEEVSGTNGLSIIQDFQIVDYVFNQLLLKIDFKYKSFINKENLLKEIKNAYFDLIEPKKKKHQDTLSNLKSLLTEENNNSRLQSVIDIFENKIEIFDIIKNNWSDIEAKALEKIYKYTGIEEGTINGDDVINDTVEKEKNYSKSSLEENGKLTSSYRLRRFLSGIEQIGYDGKVITGFLGVPTYIGFDTVYSTIEQILSSPYEIDSNFELMITRLEENTTNQKWLRQVIDKLKAADNQIKNEFVYNFAKHTLSMKFVMFSKNRNGGWTLKVYNTNASEITRVIRKQWESNFKQSPLVFVENGKYKINKERAKYLLKTFDSWQTKKTNINTSNSQLQNWLGDFGIYLSNETLNELKNKKIQYISNQTKVLLSFDKMFQKSSNTAGIFGLLADYLENILKKNDTNFEENPENHPFNNANNILKILAKIESKYASYTTTNSFRDGKKNIYSFTLTKHITDVIKSLKFDPELRKQLNKKSFNKHSFLLKFLNESELFREILGIEHIGITALKELGKKIYSDNSITALSNSDHELTKLGFFQDLNEKEINKYLGKNHFVKLRIARMFVPTMSDKSQMLILRTAVLDLKNKHFETDEKGDVKLSSNLKEIIYSQLVKPELERIVNFNSTIKKTDIKGYDTAAQMFLFIPELNNLFDPATGKRVISLMCNAPATYNIDWFENNFKEQAKDVVSSLINEEVKSKIKEWEKNGFIKTEDNKKSIQFLDKKYFDRLTGSIDEKIKVAANDYVINSLLSLANSYMLIAGDIAMYSQDKIKSYFQNGKPYLPKKEFGDKVYAKISKIIGNNASKRLALFSAPGNKLANSNNSEYKQVFLNDFVDISSNIVALVKMFYDEDETSRIKDYNNDKTLAGRKFIAEELSKKYPILSDYFEIEATDSQEYTTLSEHINVLWGQGRLTDNQYETINNKIEQQLKAESETKEIPKSAMLNHAEMKLVLQSIKPVHTGFKNEDRFDCLRMIYIKSSSFPLIPQVTIGTELDGLRRLLENYEKMSGKFVRASYNSANKVGASTNSITPFLPDGTFNKKISLEDVDQASLTLKRDNFRIQQDIPFKSDKTTEDKVSLGTQTLKLLFGDGVLNIDDFLYNGKKYSGKELHSIFNDTYNEYIVYKKNMLFKQLNVDEEGNPIKIEETISKLQELLKREAIKRNYPKQDIEALQLQPKYDNNGNVVDMQFNIPLWLSPNSNRYESLLNAIVSNKLVNIKLPGNSYVVGSEAGFKIQSDFDIIGQNNIVFTSEFDKKLKSDQIFLPSKFRDKNGNLIQFIDEKGYANPIYTTRDKNGFLRLKENMIDDQLLNVTSFRIPTSSHVSMSQLKIAGFLPTEVGDLMIIPKNLIKQKGLDFDVDKEIIYHLHTVVDDTGKISVFNEKSKQKLLKVADTKGTNILTDNSPESKLIKAIFGDDPDFNEEELNDKSFLALLNNKLTTKLYENKLIKMHSSVLSNPNIQKKINKTLSVDFARSQAQIVEEKTESNIDDKYFTMLSDQYQKDKMQSGASGKSAIGVYSNYIVFISMIQQMVSNKLIQLLQYEKDGNKIPLKIQIGNQISNGLLGRQQSLASKGLKRSIAEIFAERQNTATDNAKEEIMGKVNVNELTINVDCLLSALGFDKDVLDDGREISIPYLFLSQPIIKEYVEEIRKTQSNTAEFKEDAKEKVIEQLKSKYEIEEVYNTEKIPSLLTGQTLFDNLTRPDKMIQLEVFKTFLKLDNYAKSIALLQSTLNINRNGLGKSFFDTIDKYYSIQNIPENNENNKKGIVIKNVFDLIGKYVQNNDDVTENRKQKLLKDGYILIGDYYIKPDTPVGSMLVNAIQTGYNLWKNYFPYNDINVKSATDEILSETTNESTSFQKVIEMRQNIFEEMKKYLLSSTRLGTFENDPQKKRNELFIDTDENESLASYLRRTLRSKKELSSNKLLSRFQFEINKNGIPSLIKFDNTKGENFDEDYLYMSLIELMDQNVKLPNYNQEEYSTLKLAQDLIAYSYLEGGIQQAIQFVKYIPVSYLNILPFAGITREWNSNYRYNIFGNILGINTSKNDISRFTRQYLQHNPQRLFKINSKTQIMNADYNGKKTGKLESLTSFEIDFFEVNNVQFTKLKNTSFVTIYNPEIKNGLKKFQVYEKTGDKYKRISTLGVFGMSEYSLKEIDVHTIVNDYYKVNESQKKITKQKKNPIDIFGIKTNTVSEIVNNIADYDFTKYQHLQPIAKSLIPFINNDITIEVNAIVNSNGQRIGRGKYSSAKNEITIDNHYYNTATTEDLAKTIIHELIHTLSANYITQYVDDEGKYKQPNPPQEIQKLVILFNEAKKKLGPEIEKYAKKRQDQLLSETLEVTTERERTVAYGGTNIKEFVALIMTEPNFQKEMMNIKYKSTNKNLFDKFTEIINSILRKIFGENYDTNNVTTEGIRTSLEIIEKQSTKEYLSPFKQMEQNDMSAEDILNTKFDDTDLESDDIKKSDLSEPAENSIFENPFPCK